MNKILKATLTTASAVGLLLGTTTAAHAATPADDGNWAQFIQSTANGEAEAFVEWTDSAGTTVDTKDSSTYANGQFWDFDTDYTMNAWLERSTDGGADWSTVSGVHSLSSGDSSSGNYYAITDQYYDGPGYLARACFQFTSWSGAAVHCTDWI